MKKIWQKILCLWNAETTPRRWCKFTIAVSASAVIGTALLAFIVDPHYRYREPFFYDMVYYEIYATAPHILKNQSYDVLMLGTSMTRNFFLEDINSAFDCDAVKLAASGGTMRDLSKFFQVARDAKGDELKMVILSLDIYPLNKDYSHWEDFDYMYRDDHSEDYRYLFSRQTFSNMFFLIKRKYRPKRQRAHMADRNRMFSTEYDGKPYGLAAVLDDALHNEVTHHTQTPYDADVHRQNLYGELLPMFDENPDLEFIVYLPPYHIYTYCQSEHFGEADALISQRSEVMRELIRRPNVTLYDFQADRKYVAVHDYFSDVQHFSNVAARELLQDLHTPRRRIVTEADIAANEQELRDLIQEKMPEYYENIKQFQER